MPKKLAYVLNILIFPNTSGRKRRVEMGAVKKLKANDTHVTIENPTNLLIKDLLVSAIYEKIHDTLFCRLRRRNLLAYLPIACFDVI